MQKTKPPVLFWCCPMIVKLLKQRRKILQLRKNYSDTVWEMGKFMHGKLIQNQYTTFDETSLCIWFDNDNYLNFAADVTLTLEKHWMVVKNLYDNTAECSLIAGVYEEDPE